MGDLVEYYGEGCKFCVKIAPLIEKLEKEHNITIEKLEVWNNQGNADKLKKDDAGRCGGVPFLLNRKTKDFICGDATYERLLEWATGKKEK